MSKSLIDSAAVPSSIISILSMRNIEMIDEGTAAESISDYCAYREAMAST